MNNSIDLINSNKYLPEGRSNLEYYDLKYFLPNNNGFKKSPEYTGNHSNIVPKIYSIWSEGKPNIDNINYTNSMKKERKGQLLSLITALKNNEIKITSDEKEKIMDALIKALKNLTQKHDNKLDVSSNVNSTRNSKVNAIEEIYFGGKKKMFSNHPCLSSSIELNNNIGENNQMKVKIQNLIDYYLGQNKKEHNQQLDHTSQYCSKEFDEFVINYDKIRLNSLSPDNPNYKSIASEGSVRKNPIKNEDYTVMKFNHDNNKYDKLKDIRKSSQSIDLNKTVIKVFNSIDVDQDRLNKLKILNNLNKNSFPDAKSRFVVPNTDSFVLKTKPKDADDIFGKLVTIKKDPSKEKKIIKDNCNNVKKKEKLNTQKSEPHSDTNKKNDEKVENETKNQQNSNVEEYLKLMKKNNINLRRRAKVK